ncbi:MAG: hypothetical protein H6907_12185 [Hyphomicrobiales bacterium]|nr:hypothetical protein [Hyphomicrobiales bacterium]
MRFDVYGRYVIEVVREGDRWAAWRLDGTRRRPVPDLAIPPDLPARDLATYLDDMLHEQSPPGGAIRAID